MRSGFVPKQTIDFSGTHSQLLGLVSVGAGVTLMYGTADYLRFEGLAIRPLEPAPRLTVATITQADVAADAGEMVDELTQIASEIAEHKSRFESVMARADSSTRDDAGLAVPYPFSAL